MNLPLHSNCSRLRRLITLVAITVSTVACGGGGGESSSVGGDVVFVDPSLFANPNRNSEASRPAQGLVKSNVSRLSAEAVRTPGVVLALAKIALDAWTGAPRAGQPVASLSCRGGGAVEFQYEDHDASGHQSLGDQLTIAWRGCFLTEFNLFQTGTLVLTRIAPSSTQYSTAVHALFASDFHQYLAGPARRLINGSVIFQGRSDAVADLWNVRSAASDDLVVTYPGYEPTPTSFAVRAMDFTKSLRYDDAAIEVNLHSEFNGPMTDGAIRVQTREPLRARLDAYPETGALQLSDDQGREIEIRSLPGARANSAQASHKSAPLETDLSHEFLAWNYLAPATLWWGERGSSSPISPAMPFASLAARQPVTYTSGIDLGIDFSRALSLAGPVAGFETTVLPTLRYQFSRTPVQPFLPQFRFYPLASETASFLGMAPPLVDANVQVLGALMLVTPVRPLEANRRYHVSATMQLSGAPAVAVDASGSRVTVDYTEIRTMVDL